MNSRSSSQIKKPIIKKVQTKKKFPVVVRKPDPEVWKAAIKLAHGDMKLCEVLPDGSIMVHNNVKH